jgi:hypothetical protein
VRRIIDNAYKASKKTLTKNRGKLDQIVLALLEEETLEGESLRTVMEAPVDGEVTPKPGEAKPEAPETPRKKKESAPTPKPITQPQPGLAFESGQTPSRLESDPT